MEQSDNREDVTKQDAAAQLLRDTEIALPEAIAKGQHAVEEEKQLIAAEREALARKAAELMTRSAPP